MFSSLIRNRLRTGLTVLGIGIGIAAVICTAALGAAGSQQVQSQIDMLGEDFLWIRAGSQSVGGARGGWGTAQSLTPEDAQALQDQVPDIVACSPQIQGREQVIGSGQNWNTRYQAVLPSFFWVRKRTLAAGTFFTDADDAQGARVMVMGSSVAENLFGEDNPVGQTVRMGGFPFRVIGVLEYRGAGRGGVDRDDTVFVPLSTAHRNLDRRDSVSDIMCGVTAPSRMETAEIMATDLLRARHDLYEGEEDDFSIQKPIEILEMRAEAAETMALFLTSIGAVSLVVGGVGIMNIMLVAVTERRREIGVRLAIGARVRDIRWQFLFEAGAIGLVGAAAGIALGRVSAWVLSYGFGWPTAVNADIVALATICAVGAGLVFGYYPAHRASQLDPIDAIRTED
jgi:putative ABC transport system permease protein